MLSYLELVRLERSLRGQPVLSVYLDGTATDFATQHAWRTQLDQALDDLRAWLGGSSPGERALFERCVATLETQVGAFQHAVGAPGWAAFITGDGVRHAGSLAAPMPTKAVWRTGACVSPYLRAIKQTRPAILAVVDSRKARLYRYQSGAIEKIKTARVHVSVEPASHMGSPARVGFHAGVRGATGRDSAQRELRDGTRRLLHRAARYAIELAGVDGWIIVGGIPGVAHSITQLIAASAPERVLYADTLDVNASAAELRRSAEEGASALRNAWDLRRIEDIIENAEQPSGLFALGTAPTRHALEASRVGELFVTREYLDHDVLDAEEVVRAAFDQSAMVEELSGPAARRLNEFGGVAARLRYSALGYVSGISPRSHSPDRSSGSTARVMS